MSHLSLILKICYANGERKYRSEKSILYIYAIANKQRLFFSTQREPQYLIPTFTSGIYLQVQTLFYTINNVKTT